MFFGQNFKITENWPGQNTNSKNVFLAKTSKMLAKLNFDFVAQLSRYVIHGNSFNFFALKVLGDMARTRLALYTDIRTDEHGWKNNISLPQGKTYNDGKTH